jgi:ribosomal protein S27E
MFGWLKKLIVGETPLDVGEHRCEVCGKIKLNRKQGKPIYEKDKLENIVYEYKYFEDETTKKILDSLDKRVVGSDAIEYAKQIKQKLAELGGEVEKLKILQNEREALKQRLKERVKEHEKKADDHTETVCPECGSRQLVHDYERAELVCQSCGLVIDEDFIDRGPEWRAFDHDQRMKRSRVGAPMTFTIFVTVFSQPARSWNQEFIWM